MRHARGELIHCSYHKCLTVYYRRVMTDVMRTVTGSSAGGYRHFNSLVDEFHLHRGEVRVASVNNHALDVDALGPGVRITRFVRDPRDLVVSGYHYHRRGAEEWCHVVDPTDDDWRVVNGAVPAAMAEAGGHSFASFLSSLTPEAGFAAELEFRRRHFESMRAWPADHPSVRVFRYEDIVGNEVEVFSEVFDFYELAVPRRVLGRVLASRYSAERSGRRSEHVRDPRPGQWRGVLPDDVVAAVDRDYGDVLDRYGYAAGSAAQGAAS
jgi:Sulfotransferase domain